MRCFINDGCKVRDRVAASQAQPNGAVELSRIIEVARIA